MPLSPSHYSEGPEALIVGLAQTGDEKAFAELLRRRQSWIRNLMRRCCGDNSLADDLAQQVFLQAWRSLKQLKEADKFGSWLKRLAVNTWLQHQRKNDPLHDTEEHDDSIRAQEDGTAVIMDLDKALGILPGQVRLCVVLSYHERLSHGEIAELAELPIGTVKSHIRRGTLRLRELLSAYAENSNEEPS